MTGPKPPAATNSDPADDPAVTAALLWDMEQRFWTEGADGARHMSAKDAVCIFPEPSGILQGSDLWRDHAVAQRWRSVDMTDQFLTIRGTVAVLAYRAAAERGSDPVHVALCSSTYLRTGAIWQRLVHQETPAGS